MIRVTNQYIWNIVFLLFFCMLLTMGVIILDTEARIAYEELTLFDVALITLATYRLIRLFVYDALTKFFREQFWDAKETRGKVLLTKPKGGPRRTLADLLSCPWCFGVWAAAMVSFFYLLTPLAVFPVLLLAIAGVATWIQLLTNMIGWKAEQLKREMGE